MHGEDSPRCSSSPLALQADAAWKHEGLRLDGPRVEPLPGWGCSPARPISPDSAAGAWGDDPDLDLGDLPTLNTPPASAPPAPPVAPPGSGNNGAGPFEDLQDLFDLANTSPAAGDPPCLDFFATALDAGSGAPSAGADANYWASLAAADLGPPAHFSPHDQYFVPTSGSAYEAQPAWAFSAEGLDYTFPPQASEADGGSYPLPLPPRDHHHHLRTIALQTIDRAATLLGGTGMKEVCRCMCKIPYACKGLEVRDLLQGRTFPLWVVRAWKPERGNWATRTDEVRPVWWFPDPTILHGKALRLDLCAPETGVAVGSFEAVVTNYEVHFANAHPGSGLTIPHDLHHLLEGLLARNPGGGETVPRKPKAGKVRAGSRKSGRGGLRLVVRTQEPDSQVLAQIRVFVGKTTYISTKRIIANQLECNDILAARFHGIGKSSAKRFKDFLQLSDDTNLAVGDVGNFVVNLVDALGERGVLDRRSAPSNHETLSRLRSLWAVILLMITVEIRGATATAFVQPYNVQYLFDKCMEAISREKR